MVVQSAGLTDDAGSHDGFRKIKSAELSEPSLVNQNPTLLKHFLSQVSINLNDSCYKLRLKFLSLLINLQPSWGRAMYMSNFRFIYVKNTGPALEISTKGK